MVFDGVFQQDLCRELAFKNLPGALRLFHRSDRVTIYNVAQLQDGAAQCLVRQILIEIIDAISKMIPDPRNVATKRDGSDGGHFKDTIRNDVVPQMQIGQQAKADPIRCVCLLDARSVEFDGSAITVRTDMRPRVPRAAYLDAFCLAKFAEELLPALIPIRAEIGDSQHATAGQASEVRRSEERRV